MEESHIHIHLPGLASLETKLDYIIKKLRTMAKKLTDLEQQINDLSAKADGLQTTLDAEQQQIQDAIGALGTTITENNALIQQLRDELAQAGVDADTVDRLTTTAKGINSKLDAIKTDLEGTIADQPTPQPEPEPQPNPESPSDQPPV